MLIARAPVRLSFFGGGTDLPAYASRFGGLVVSTTIDKYFYVFATPKRDDGLQVTSSDYRAYFHRGREAEPLWDGDLRLVRAALDEFGYASGLSLFLASEVPPGSGLGSSGAVAVALVKALAALRGESLSKADVAARACVLEIERLGAPIGKQDPFASAYGGLNIIEFDAEAVRVTPLVLAAETRRRMEGNLLLFFTGITRRANDILREQAAATERPDGGTIEALHALKEIARAGSRSLAAGDLDRFGELLDESWRHKKRLAHGVSDERIDEAYDLAIRAGAAGGKITGAGGGGFLLLYCDESRHAAVTERLERYGMRRMDYRFERSGGQVLMNALAGVSLPATEALDARSLA